MKKNYSLKNKPQALLFFLSLLLFASYMNGQNYVSYTITGLNEDVIAETGDLAGTTTASVDKATDNYCYITENVGITYGLPLSGELAYNDVTYQLVDYASNNSLRLIGPSNSLAGAGGAEEGNPTSATITFAESESLEIAYLAVTSGSGSSSVSGTINFDDSSTQSFVLSVPDWYANSGTIVANNLGRGNRGNNSLSGAPSGGPYIFQLSVAIDVANQSKNVLGITIQNDATGDSVFNLFAVSGKIAAPCPSPSNISSTSITAYDADITWDPYDPGDTFEVAIVNAGAAEPTTGTATATNTYNFDNLTPETSYDVYVRTVCVPSGYSYWIGPFNFTTPVACIAPTGLTVTSITTSSATVTWDMGTATDWEFAYVPAGDPAPASGTPLSSATSDLSSLTENTSYDVYVRTDCGVDGYSSWSSITFTTACLSVAGINEDFEGTNDGEVPNCWSVINGGDANTWSVQSTGWPSYPHSGSKYARITYSSTAHNDYLITPAFTVTDHVSDIISFWSRNYDSFYVDEFDVLVSTTGNQESDFTDTLASNVAPPTTYTEYTYDLSAYEGQTIYFAIRAISTNEYYLYIDDVVTSGEPYCDAPTDLTLGNVTPTAATLSWTDSVSSSWEVVVQDVGMGVPSGSGVTVVATTYDASYTLGTPQELYVRALCSDNVSFSPWVGPIIFGDYTSLEITGLNADVIANGIGDSSISAPQDIDGAGYAYLSRDFKVLSTDSDLTYGLPIDGVINSPNTMALKYEMNSYDSNNSLRLESSGVGETLTLQNAYPAEKVFLLVTSGSGQGLISGTINFSDNSTQTFSSLSVPDWYYSTALPVAISGIGRINTTNNGLENPSNNPRIYELEIVLDMANQDKTITSIDVTKDSGGVVNIFAVSQKFSTAALSVDTVNSTPLSVYPNPVKDNLYIKGVEATNVQVYDIIGKEIHVGYQDNVVDMASLPSGIYLVRIENGLGKSETIKVVKD